MTCVGDNMVLSYSKFCGDKMVMGTAVVAAVVILMLAVFNVYDVTVACVLVVAVMLATYTAQCDAARTTEKERMVKEVEAADQCEAAATADVTTVEGDAANAAPDTVNMVKALEAADQFEAAASRGSR